jgi:exonuclease SbcD
MRFLHTGDWHVAKTLRGRHREDEYAAALAEVLDIARREQVDCLLVAGDVFDSAAPSAEAERLVYDFFRELWGALIPAVVIGGNHDHPRRLVAVSGLLEVVGVHVRGEPLPPETGGVVEVPSRDGRETALVAALPWVPERRVVAFDDLLQSQEEPFKQYADRTAKMLDYLSRPFRADTVNIVLAHILIDGAVIGPGGGERPLHLGQAYAISAERLPARAQYIALGHVHRPQEVVTAAPTHYAGSLLQLDFGEREQSKSVLLVDVHPSLPAHVQPVPLSAGKELRDVSGSLAELQSLADDAGDAFLRVFVRADGAVANLAEQVRAILPNAVDVRCIRPGEPAQEKQRELLAMGPDELFATFHQQARGHQAPEAVLALFRRLYEEEALAAP